jgi:mRNA interferase MazF
MPPLPARGEIWTADLNPVRGHEQAGQRPVLIVSTDQLNHGPAGVVFVVPLTRTARTNPFFVPIVPPEGGVRRPSYAICTALRSISVERLGGAPWGAVSATTLAIVGDRLRMLLEL